MRSLTTVEFNDNITSSATNKKSDIIIAPGIEFDTTWDISEFNDLNFNIATKYRKYMKNSQFDSDKNFLYIASGSQLRFNVYIKDFTISFFDKFSYDIDPSDARAVEGGNIENDPSIFERFNNNMGMSVTWNMNDVIWDVGLSRKDLIPKGDEFKSLRRTTNILSSKATIFPLPNVTTGLMGSYSVTTYEVNDQNGSTGIMIGPFVEWQMTHFTNINAKVQLTHTDFDSDGTNGDSSNVKGITGRFAIDNELNPVYRHTLALSHQEALGFVSNSISIQKVEYDATYQMLSEFSVQFGGYWELGKESGGIEPEKYDRFGANFGFGLDLSKKLSSSVSLRHTRKNSNISSRTYDQNSIVFSFAYDF